MAIMKRQRPAEDTVAEVAAAALDDGDETAFIRSLYDSQGYVVIRDLFPKDVVRWLRVECDALSESVNLIDADCMVDPLEGIDVMDDAQVRSSSELVLHTLLRAYDPRG